MKTARLFFLVLALAGWAQLRAVAQQPYTYLGGQTYLDLNGNGRRDSGERFHPIPAVFKEEVNNLFTNTAPQYGTFYMFSVPTLRYHLSVPNVPAGLAITQPASGFYSGSFSGWQQSDTALHFGFRPVTGFRDLAVYLTPVNSARPGFTTTYNVTVLYAGAPNTSLQSGSVTLHYDSHLHYLSSSPSGIEAGNSVTWNFSNLQPNVPQRFQVIFNLPTSAQMGMPLTSSAEVTAIAGDALPGNDRDTVTQTVVNSFDPNDKLVNRAYVTPAQVQSGEPLEYTIRFQNLGTAPAVHVSITDMLDIQTLRPEFIEIIASKHNLVWSIDANREVTFNFFNINLPPQSQDAIASHGFVRFRVKPQNTLVLGDRILNTARIKFDFNPSIQTNTASTIVGVVTAADALLQPENTLLYPNPAAGEVSLQAELPQTGAVEIAVCNMLGQQLHTERLQAAAGPFRHRLQLDALPAGLYLVQLRTAAGTLSQRLIRL